MPPPTGSDFMSTLRVNEVFKDILDVRTIPGELMFLNRLKQNPTTNKNLIAKWKGNVQIADLIAPNSPGVAYKAERIYLEAINTQMMKIGTVWSGDELEEYFEMRDRLMSDPEDLYGMDIFERAVKRHIVGTEWRKEWLAVGMASDGYYGVNSYNRLGFSLSPPDGRQVTWGMKPDMKQFVPIPLGNPDGTVNVACPIITYIFNMIEIRRRRYGRPTNRLTMNTATKRAIQQTTEFKADAVFQQAPFTTFNNITPSNYPLLDDLLKRVLNGFANGNNGFNLEVVTYDAVYQSENGDGLPSQYVPFLPLAPEAAIFLDDTMNDRNDEIHDFGVGRTLESRAESLRYTDGIPGTLPPGKNGTFSWLDVPKDLDPVRAALWTVERGWPRKKDEVCESVLFIGPLTDPVPLSDIVIV